MAVQFIVDSASDILPQEKASLGIAHVLPLKVLFGTEEYADGVDLSHEDFYKKLTSTDVHPTTCQVPPADFEAAYQQVTSQGDTAVVITISGKLSGTYQSAVIAAEDYEGKVFVVDSENAALGERCLVMRGLQLRSQGLSADQIAAQLDQEKKEIRLFALLDTLEYLKKGGRISATVAFAGGLLNIKPVIAVEDGLVAMAGKARGPKAGAKLLTELMEKSGGVDFDRFACFAYSGLDKSGTQAFAADCGEEYQKLPLVSVGCTIGVHVGPGVTAIAYFAKH